MQKSVFVDDNIMLGECYVKREYGNLLSIADNYPKYVVSMDKVPFSRDGIIHKNLIDFLLER